MRVPSSASDVLGVESPIVGEPEAVEAIADYLGRLVIAARNYEQHAAMAGLELSGDLSEVVTGLGGKLDERLRPGARKLADGAVEGKRAMNRYASDVDRIHADARRVIRDVDRALQAIRGAALVIESIEARLRVTVLHDWRTVPSARMPDPVTMGTAGMSEAEREVLQRELVRSSEADWRRATAQWRRALEEIDERGRRWSALIAERRGAESCLLRSLRATELGVLLRLCASATGYDPTQALALAVAGEHRGQPGEGAKRHPLLQKLIGSESGERIWGDPPDPTEVAANWHALAPAEQQRLVEEAPWVIGNLPGLPFAVRDAANRRVLEFYRLNRSLLSERGRAVLDGLERIRARGEAPQMSVVALDLEGEVPKVAVGYGDLDRADHLTWEVPGMASDADQALHGWDRASRNLHIEQREIIRSSHRSGEVGVIAFLEYDTPDAVTVLQPDLARDGAIRLAHELDGTWATRNRGSDASPGFRAPGAPTVGVVAHSYGTTTAADALTLVRTPVDAFSLAGSAGLDTGTIGSLEDLQVVRDVRGTPNIYASHAAADRLAPLGLHYAGRGNPNPELRYRSRLNYPGAKHYGSDGYRPPDGPMFAATDGHSVIGENIEGVAGPHRVLNSLGFEASEGHGYWDRNTQSLRNLAATSLGMEDQIVGTWYAPPR